MTDNEKQDWPDWDELELLPGIGYMRRSEIAAALKREQEREQEEDE